MKNKLLYILSLTLILASCKKYLDINETPNNPLVVPPSTILPVTTVGMAFAASNELGRLTSVVMQYNTGLNNQVAQEDIYNLDNLLDNQWSNEIYGTAIQNLRILVDQYESSSPAYSGIAKLQLAYLFSTATDLWGDVPYSEAGYGLKFSSPRFDKQEDIYMGNPDLGIVGLFDLVKNGLADLNKPTLLKPGLNSGDIVYAKTAADTAGNGNITKWKRMGNTLLLKFALQISNRNPAYAKSTIESVLATNLYINANNLDFEVPFGTSTGNQNPLYSFNNINRTGDLILSSRFLSLMRSQNDTFRLAKYYTKPTGNFVAFENGSVGTAPAAASRSKYNTYLTGSTGEAPVRLLTNAQVQFIWAEAALVLGSSGDPNAYYQAGIRASMQKVGMTEIEISDYFTTNTGIVTLSGIVEDKRKQIITQKYIAQVGNAIESYNDFRRTGYPQLTLPLNTTGDVPGVFPQRLPYTPNELARNPNAPNPRPKTDVKVWWAK